MPECQCIPGLDGSVALTLLRDGLLWVCSGSDLAEAVLLAAFPSGRMSVVADTACVVPFLLDPAAALGCVSPWHMKLRCLDLVAAFLLGVSSALCTRQPPTASVLARLCWRAFVCLPGPPSMCGCFAYGPGPILARRACLRLILFLTCPPLCDGALWPMPTWVWCDVGSLFSFPGCKAEEVPAIRDVYLTQPLTLVQLQVWTSGGVTRRRQSVFRRCQKPVHCYPW